MQGLGFKRGSGEERGFKESGVKVYGSWFMVYGLWFMV